jgi:hypothetical protein
MDFELKPCKAIRELDLRKIIGLEVVLHGQHSDDKKTDQYFNIKKESEDKINEILGEGCRFYFNGWVGRYVGEKDAEVKTKISDAYLMNHANGGRDWSKRSYTYKEFFDDKQRAKIDAERMGGLMARLTRQGSGDPDRADIILKFENGMKLETMQWDIECPEEWYSELHATDSRFRFVDGFYPDAEKAIEAFSKKGNDDMFGERYFPVLAFPKSTPNETIQDVIWRPKAVSDPILTQDYIVYGSRCKPHEFAETIDLTYKVGGKVPIGVEWNW